jgi:two-component system NarL family response regulator
MDIQMPSGDGLEATAQLRQKMPEVHVIILTASESDDHLYKAVRLGAAGYLLKSLDAAELFDLLTGVAHGEAALSRTIAAHLLKGMASLAAGDAAGEESLTQREIDVLRLIARGATNSAIAESLCISVNTVKVHLRNILEKLQLSNRTQVATYALQSGLAQSTQPQAAD